MADQGTDKVGSTGETSSVVTLALFGLGRAGSIHLANIVANRKVELKYIVESDQSKWASVRNKFNLVNNVKFLKVNFHERSEHKRYFSYLTLIGMRGDTFISLSFLDQIFVS